MSLPSAVRTDGTTEHLWGRLRTALSRRLRVDLRALAALRIGLGCLLLADLLLRSRDLVAFYTDAGVLPQSLLYAQYPTVGRLSLHALSEAAWYQAALFVLAGICAVCLLVGYRTRVAVLCSWLLLVSLHARNPLVLNGGDSVLRRLLFWSLFLPLGARWSVDASRGRVRWGTAPGTRTVVGGATVGLLLQVILIYTVNAGFKLKSERWTSGDALAYVFELGEFTTPVGTALTQYPGLLTALDTVWLVLLVGSVLLVATTGWRRVALVGLFVGAHLSMAATMRLGLFPYISVVALVPFLPTGVWNRVERALGRMRPVRVRLLPTRRPSAPSPIAGYNSLGSWCRETACIERLLSNVPKRLSRNYSRQYEIGPDKNGRRRYSTTFRRTAGQAARVVVVGVLLLMLCWNAMSLGLVDTPAVVSESVSPGSNGWTMFVGPPDTEFWLIAPATTDSGERVDALHGGRATSEPPPAGTARYPNSRWRKYAHNAVGNDRLYDGVAHGLCERRQRHHSSQIESLELTLVTEETNLGGADESDRTEIASYSCPVGQSA